MVKISLLSDNHGFFSPDVLLATEGSDEIWHAGDMGTLESIEPFRKKAVFRGVFGNIDGRDIRLEFSETIYWDTGGIKVLMTHIGGYPDKYPEKIKNLISEFEPDLFICGHSHILKVIKDQKLYHLHMNPGAYGHHGFHIMRTLLRFNIENGKITRLEAVELGRRGII